MEKTNVKKAEIKEVKQEESWVIASDGRHMRYKEWIEEQKANRDW